MAEQERAPVGIDPTIPSVARMYDFYLGGKDNFAADREAAAKIVSIVPNVKEVARANRAFMGRAVRVLAELGIRQFLDIGTGLPTQDNVHQVAQAASSRSHVVYVDNDPIVLVHARALLAETPDTIVVDADMREPEGIIGHPKINEHLDFKRPIAVLMLSVLHFVPDDDEAARIVQTIRDALPSGSYLILSHVTPGKLSEKEVGEGRGVYSTTSAGNVTPRSRAQIAAYFDGLEMLKPGLVPVGVWRSDAEEEPVIPGPRGAEAIGAVARVP